MSRPATALPPRQLLALALISAALLGYEVLLPRIIAIQHWHHLTEVVIAVALLGLASAAVLLAALADTARRHQRWLCPAATLATAAAIPCSVLLAQQLPLNMLALPWYWQQALYLALYGLCFVLPFFCGGLFITLVFMRGAGAIGTCYAADLGGGAVGVALVLLWLDGAWPGSSLETAVLLCSALALLALPAAATAAWRIPCSVAVLAVALAGWHWHARLVVAPSPFKALPVQLHERGAHLLAQLDSSHSRLSRVSAAGQHLAPGLSLASTLQAPHQQQLFVDGGGAMPLLLDGPRRAHRALFDQVLGGAAYLVAPHRPSVLVLPGNPSWHAWNAYWHAAHSIALVEPDRALAALLRRGGSAGAQFLPPGARLHVDQPRRFLERTAARYDAVIVAVDSQPEGSAATRIQLLLTRPALAAMLERLSPRGVLALEGQLMPWPRDSLRIINSLVAVLQARGLAPREHLVVIRDWRNYLLLVRRTPFSSEQLAALQSWCRQWQFDPIAMPGIDVDPQTLFHQSPDERFVESVQTLFSRSRAAFVADYLFDLSTTDDDRPFFYHFFRWESWRAAREALGRPWLLYVGWGYLLNVAALGALAVAACALLLARLAAPDLRTRLPRGRLALVVYFGAIGLGFMALEIALLQKAVLLVNSSTEAFALVLVTLLLGAGLGSYRAGSRLLAGRVFWCATACVIGAALTYPLLIDHLYALSHHWPDTARRAALVLLLLLPALPMGLMLPQGIAAIRHCGGGTVAWCWAVNGFFSVCGALAAPLLAIELGWSGLAICAAGLYLLAGIGHGFLRRGVRDGG